MSLNAYKLLTKDGNVEYLDVRSIIDKNGIPLSVQDIIAYVPNASNIGISRSYITPKTFTKLAALKRNCKISNFTLHDVSKIVDEDILVKFIEVHASPEVSSFYMLFINSFSFDAAKIFDTTIKQKIFFNKKFANFPVRPYFFAGV